MSPTLPPSGRTSHLLCVSAHDEAAFQRRVETLAEHLAGVAAAALNDVCFTLHTSSEHHSRRAAVVGKTGGELAEALRRAVPRERTDRDDARVAVMFTGQGSQYPRMARELYATEPAFRDAFDAASACFGRELGAPLQELVIDGLADAARLAETDLTQPAVFAVDYAMGRLLLAWGVRPHCLLGHSVGEYAAACLANVLALPSAARLVRERGRLMHELPTRGGMAAVFASADQVAPLLEPVRDRAFIAAYNGAHVVVAGEPRALDELAPRFDRAGLVHRRLAVSQAFHTPLLRPMTAAFRRAFDGVAIHRPSVTLISNVTGEVVDGPLDADYWVRHVLEPVRFAQSIQAALRHGAEVFVEAGPDRVLSEMCRGLLGTAAAAVPTLQRKGEDTPSVLAAVGELYVRGAHVDFGALHGVGARRVRGLPVYPLAATSLGRPGIANRTPGAAAPQPQAAAAMTPAVWAWTVEAPRRRAVPGYGRLLVVAPERLRPPLERALGRAGDRWVLAATPGASDLARLAVAAQAERPIGGVVYLLAGWTGAPGRDPAWDEGVELGVHGLVGLAKALQDARGAAAMPLVLATRGAMGVLAGEAPHEVWQSPAIAVVQGLAREEPWLDARAIDLDATASDEAVVRAALDELSIEPGEERIAAIRAAQRLARTLRPAPAPDPGLPAWRPRDGETYLLTGAGGGIGAELALHIARRARVHLVITGRRPLSPPDAAAPDAGAAERTQLVRTLQLAGAEVRYEAVDVTDRAAMADLVRRTQAAFGPIHGVVHGAGVVDRDALRLIDKTAPGLRRVFAPKLRGVVVLDEVTRDQPLQFFAALSSVAASRSAWGKGLADYAAANFFLDQYCLLRASSGAPGRSLAINWSLWRGLGMARTPGLEALVERHGLEVLEPEVALRTFDEAIARTEPVLHVFQTLPEGAEHRVPAGPVAAAGPAPTGEAEIHRVVLEVLAEHLRVATVDGGKSFRELGVDSLAAVQALRKLEARLHRKLYPTLFFEFKTPAELARYLASSGSGEVEAAASDPPPSRPAPRAPSAGPRAQGGATADPRDIAIIGMACRFPGAESPEAYWELLRSGKTVIGEVPAHRFDVDTSYDAAGTAAHASYSRWGAFVDDPYAFDAMFFGISPREAVSMDPQQRIFLEVAWQTIQRAGYANGRPADLGVFVGCEGNAYVEHFVNSQRHAAILGALGRAAWFQALPAAARADLLATLVHHLEPAEITSDVVAGNGLNEVAARVSHFLDAHGPSMILNSACSSSLVAMHVACDSLRRGETSMAIAGGVFLNLGTTASVFLSKLKALSPTGECRPFDRRANGLVLGEGAAAVVLKPLSAALRDRDHVHAVIKGSAVTNDGHSSGITVPSAAGQADAIRRAYREFGIDPATVSYIECHGTATQLGDPIEIQGLSQAIGSVRSTPCTIGSVKGAVGHALAAAGASSVLKVALALEARTIAPTAGYDEPTPHVDFGPFEVAHGSARPWDCDGPRRAGVNAFGFGGTNCHLILEEAPETPEVPELAGSHLLCLYGRTPEALHHWAGNVQRAVAARPEVSPSAVCAALDRSQRRLASVAACVVRDRAELITALAAIAAGVDLPGLHRGKGSPRHQPNLVLALGTEWLPRGTDAEALAGGAPRLAASLADALAALRGARRPERAALISQYLVARVLGELGMHASQIVGQGDAAAVAACLRDEITVTELAAGAASDRAGPASSDTPGAAAGALILTLGAPLAFVARQGWGSAATVQAGPGPVSRPWALDLLAQLQAHGASLALDARHDERPVHVPLADYPFDRTTYRAFDEAQTAPSPTHAQAAAPARTLSRAGRHP